jgi:type I restriction enzyme R subunit
LPYTNADWEKLAIFLNFLTPNCWLRRKMACQGGILDAIDRESYRLEIRSARNIMLANQDAEDAEIELVPTSGGDRVAEPELERLSSTLKACNDLFGNIDWKNGDKIHRVIAEGIPPPRRCRRIKPTRMLCSTPTSRTPESSMT